MYNYESEWMNKDKKANLQIGESHTPLQGGGGVAR